MPPIERTRGFWSMLRWLPAVLVLVLIGGTGPRAAPAPPAAPLPPTPPGFVLVPAGSFIMGAEADDRRSFPDEQPQHRVTLSAFFIGAHEVTQAEYAAIMGANPSYFDFDPRLPVDSVNWFDAIAYCNARSLYEGLQPVYVVEGEAVRWDRQADGYRLPSEAEWEAACRAARQSAFMTGDCLSTDQANFNGYEMVGGCRSGMYRAQPLPVGSFAPNDWGLFDMHGNTYEWCWDAFGPYTAGKQSDPTGPEQGDGRVVRGGGWFSVAAGCRCAKRYDIPAHWARDFIGFRVVRSLID